MKKVILLSLVLILSACAMPKGTETIAVTPYGIATHRGVRFGGPSTTPVKIMLFTESLRNNTMPGRVGDRKTISGASLGAIQVSPPPSQIMRHVIQTEITLTRHPHAENNAFATIQGDVNRFDVQTKEGDFYWDVIANIDLTLVGRNIKGASVIRHYPATCSRRTYLWRYTGYYDNVIRECLYQIGWNFRHDQQMAAVLSGE